MAQRFWHSWQHGAMISVMVFLGAALGALCIGVPAYIILALLGIDPQLAVQVVLLLAIVWFPFGLGMVARNTSFDALKPGADRLVGQPRL